MNDRIHQVLPIAVIVLLLAAGLPANISAADLASTDAPLKGGVAYVVNLPLTLGAIRPQGWLRTLLEAQRDGLTGHLDELVYPFNSVGWTGEIVIPSRGLHVAGQNPVWAYEQVGSYVEGAIRLGHLLNDKKLIEKALTQTRGALKNADVDGLIFGKKFSKSAGVGFYGATLSIFQAITAV